MSKTVKVKIGVVVDENGDWSAVGWKNMPDNERGVAADGVNGLNLRWFWLEAELPLPSDETIAAAIVETTEP